VNHVDAFIRSGAYRADLPFRFIVGRDLVGTIAAVGELYRVRDRRPRLVQ
jgi:NADPH:quinone reductase-like Zn-dependent oxidoreductase